MIYLNLRDTVKAKIESNKALEISIKNFSENHIDTANVYDQLSSIYSLENDYDKSLELALKSVEIKKKIMKENSLEIAICYINLSQVYSSKSKYEESLKYAFKSYGIILEIFQGDYKNANLISALNEIGMIYNRLGQSKKALVIFNKIHDLNKEILGENSIPYANTCFELAGLYLSSNEVDKAEDFIIKAQKVFLSTTGENSINNAMCLDQLGNIYCQKGNFLKGIPYIIKAISIKESISSESLDVGYSYSELLKIYIISNSLGEAMTCLKKTETILKKILGPVSEPLFYVYYDVGIFFFHTTRFNLASKFLEMALAQRLDLFGENDPIVQEILVIKEYIKPYL
jgi:tetratricopeptide (TPR) repeat protein